LPIIGGWLVMPDITETFTPEEFLAVQRHYRNSLTPRFQQYWRVFGGMIEPEYEYRFHPTRRWRFDVAFPKAKVAVELDGGVYTQGRHTRGAGFEGDCEKINAALDLGWVVYRYSGGMLEGDPQTVMDQIKAAVIRRS
jgi:very-short-patch-repair endonuclease